MLPRAPQPGVCAVTGLQCDTVRRADLFGKSFTDGALLAAPQSERVGVAAYLALSYKWERMSSWITDGQRFTRLNRIGVRAAVLTEPPSLPWAAYATTSYKKHGALRARINAHGRAQWLFESRLVDCSDRAKLAEHWRRLHEARVAGVPRAALETLECSGAPLRALGVSAWMAFERWARPRYRGALYAFVCYLLPSEEELAHAKQDRG